MLHAVLFMVASQLFRRYWLPPLTGEQKTVLPSYYIKAERIQAWIFAICWNAILAVVVFAAIGEALGY